MQVRVQRVKGWVPLNVAEEGVREVEDSEGGDSVAGEEGGSGFPSPPVGARRILEIVCAPLLMFLSSVCSKYRQCHDSWAGPYIIPLTSQVRLSRSQSGCCIALAVQLSHTFACHTGTINIIIRNHLILKGTVQFSSDWPHFFTHC